MAQSLKPYIITLNLVSLLIIVLFIGVADVSNDKISSVVGFAVADSGALNIKEVVVGLSYLLVILTLIFNMIFAISSINKVKKDV